MLADLDRLVGRQSEPRRAYVPRERFRVRHEPTYELTYHDTLLRHLAPLLDALEEFLRVRQSAIEVLVLRLAHRERAERGIPPCTQLVLRLSSADFLAARFALPPEEMVYCGMAVGHPDLVQPVNDFPRDRITVDELAQFRGF